MTSCWASVCEVQDSLTLVKVVMGVQLFFATIVPPPGGPADELFLSLSRSSPCRSDETSRSSQHT